MSPGARRPREPRIRYVPCVRSGRPTAAAGLLVAAAVLSGCTSTVTGTATIASGGATATSTAARTPDTQHPPGEAALQGALLQLADLPTDWGPRRSGTVDPRSMPHLAACLGGRDSSTDMAERGGTSAFVDVHADTIASTAASFLSQDDVDSDAALLRDPRASDCFASALSDAMKIAPVPGGSTSGKVSFTITPGDAGGPGNVMAVGTGSIPLTNPAEPTVTIHVEYVFISGRMAEAELAFISGTEPPPADLRDRLVATVAQRMAAL